MLPYDSLEPWARSRRLTYTPQDLLPPRTPRLRAGLGVGERRAGISEPGPFGTTSVKSGYFVKGTGKRPERATYDLCRGTLPGGAEGVLARHVHLERYSSGDGEGWTQIVSTVVVVDLHEGCRPAAELTIDHSQPLQALATVHLSRPSSDARRTMVTDAPARIEREGWTFRADASVDERDLEVLAGPTVLKALRLVPEAIVEVDHGTVCVWQRHLAAGDQLDALCLLASAVAGALGSVADRHAPLEAAAAVQPPAPTDRARWIDAGVRLVDWPQPPASIPEAEAAYAAVVAESAGRRGLLAGGIAFVTGIVLTVLATAVAGALDWFLFDPAIGVITALFVFVVGIWRTIKATFSTRREMTDDETLVRARPWAVEAFAREYASAHGMTLEDAHALRRRFRAPLPGVPLKAMHGDLGDGVPGHLVLWLDPADGRTRRLHLVAIADASHPGAAAAVRAPYRATERDGQLTVSIEVDDAGRTAAALDALAAETARLARNGAAVAAV